MDCNTNPTKNQGLSGAPEGYVVPVPLVAPSVANPVISHGRGKDREMLTTSGTYPWSFVTKIFHKVDVVFRIQNFPSKLS